MGDTIEPVTGPFQYLDCSQKRQQGTLRGARRSSLGVPSLCPWIGDSRIDQVRAHLDESAP